MVYGIPKLYKKSRSCQVLRSFIHGIARNTTEAYPVRRKRLFLRIVQFPTQADGLDSARRNVEQFPEVAAPEKQANAMRPVPIRVPAPLMQSWGLVSELPRSNLLRDLVSGLSPRIDYRGAALAIAIPK